MKTWRVLTDGEGGATEPLSAIEIAQHLWADRQPFLWAEPVDGGDGAFPQDVAEVRSILLADLPRVAHSYLKHSSQPEWVFCWVMELCQYHPNEAWPLVQALVEVSRDDTDLASVAAGPIELFLNDHGDRVIGRMELEAASSPAFRRALSGVWPSSITPAVWARVVKAAGDGPGLDG